MINLKPNEVFVFGSNSQGFHGAGAAGLAMRGDSGNNWRDDKEFIKQLKTVCDKRGKWAVLGVARGFQEGKEGKSYAIQTVTRPGARRSVSLNSIRLQVEELYSFANKHPEWIFLLTPVGTGYAGYTKQEIENELAKLSTPPNINKIGWEQKGNGLT